MATATAATLQPSSATTGQQLEPFVDAIKAGAFLSLRPRRILELARQGVIPAYPLGDGQRRVWRFRLSEVTHALCSRGVHCRHAVARTRRDKT
jgi:hypothetical protein